MSTETIKLYNILTDLGIDKAKAEEAVAVYLTKEEAAATLATKEDVQAVRSDIKDLRAELWRALLIHGLVVVGAILVASQML